MKDDKKGCKKIFLIIILFIRSSLAANHSLAYWKAHDAQTVNSPADLLLDRASGG